MRIKIFRDAQKVAQGYILWLSDWDTLAWASRPGRSWPGSTISGHRLCVTVDDNGLADFTLDGRALAAAQDISGDELDAIVSDHLPKSAQHLWPAWKPAHNNAAMPQEVPRH